MFGGEEAGKSLMILNAPAHCMGISKYYQSRLRLGVNAKSRIGGQTRASVVKSHGGKEFRVLEDTTTRAWVIEKIRIESCAIGYGRPVRACVPVRAAGQLLHDGGGTSESCRVAKYGGYPNTRAKKYEQRR